MHVKEEQLTIATTVRPKRSILVIQEKYLFSNYLFSCLNKTFFFSFQKPKFIITDSASCFSSNLVTQMFQTMDITSREAKYLLQKLLNKINLTVF